MCGDRGGKERGAADDRARGCRRNLRCGMSMESSVHVVVCVSRHGLFIAHRFPPKS